MGAAYTYAYSFGSCFSKLGLHSSKLQQTLGEKKERKHLPSQVEDDVYLWR